MKLPRAVEGHIYLGASVVECIKRFRQTEYWMPESGGMLLGRRMESSNIHIDIATEPSPSDRRSRFRFLRVREPAQATVDAAWERSSGEVNYLGEWHTHPETSPTPSLLDICNWKGIIRKAVFEGDSLLFLIGGTDELAIWEVLRVRSKIVLCARIAYI